MNKYFLPICLILASVASAAPRRHVRSRLKFLTNLRVPGLYELEVEGSEVRVNGRTLARSEVILGNQWIAESVSKSLNHSGENCAAGTYERELTMQGKKSIEKGCLGTPRFASLHRAFTELAKRRAFKRD